MNRKTKFDLSGKVAVITGGASGLGLAAAERMIESGAKVVIADYNPKGQEVANQIGAVFCQTDVSNDESVKALFEKTVEMFGCVDITVASAGIGGDMNPIDQETLPNWEKVNAVDYTGIMLTDKYAIAQMLKQETGGAIINIASMFGLVAVPNNIAYSSAKGGVVNLSRAAGTMYADRGIRVNAVCPGVIETPLIDEAARNQYRGLHPAKRLGKPEEVGALITFLASDEAKFITGTSIAIDGGYTAV